MLYRLPPVYLTMVMHSYRHHSWLLTHRPELSTHNPPLHSCSGPVRQPVLLFHSKIHLSHSESPPKYSVIDSLPVSGCWMKPMTSPEEHRYGYDLIFFQRLPRLFYQTGSPLP